MSKQEFYLIQLNEFLSVKDAKEIRFFEDTKEISASPASIFLINFFFLQNTRRKLSFHVRFYVFAREEHRVQLSGIVRGSIL